MKRDAVIGMILYKTIRFAEWLDGPEVKKVTWMIILFAVGYFAAMFLLRR